MRSKMIILEGGECVGKTTIANGLMEDFNAKLIKGQRIPDRFQLLHSCLDDITEQLLRTSVGDGERLVVVDRWPGISDIVYEKYCYGKESIMGSVLPYLKQPFERSNIHVIYLEISEKEMLRRLSVRGDNLRTVDEALITRKAYQEFFKECPVPYTKLEVSGLKPYEVYEKIVEIIKEEI